MVYTLFVQTTTKHKSHTTFGHFYKFISLRRSFFFRSLFSVCFVSRFAQVTTEFTKKIRIHSHITEIINKMYDSKKIALLFSVSLNYFCGFDKLTFINIWNELAVFFSLSSVESVNRKKSIQRVSLSQPKLGSCEMPLTDNICKWERDERARARARISEQQQK